MQPDQRKVPRVALAQIAGRLAHLGVWIADLVSGRVYWSDEVCDVLEVERGTFPTIEQALEIFLPEWQVPVRAAFALCGADGTPFDLEVQVGSGAGRPLWVRTIGEAVRVNGAIVQVQGALQSIQAARMAEEQRLRLADRLTNTLELITDAFVMVNRDWTFGYLNREAERLMHCKREDVLGKNLWACFPSTVDSIFEREYKRAMADNVPVAFDEFYPPLDLWTEVRAFPSEEGLAIYFVDVRARKMAEAEIRALAYFDSLTGLPNRQLLVDRLSGALDGTAGAVMIIDLDHFKSINDTRGHDKGDMLLKLVSERLHSAVGGGDVLARFGGDEFVVILNKLGNDPVAAAQRAMSMARVLLATFASAFDIEGIPHYSGASIGVALCAGQTSAEEVLRQADLAMYHAKGAGRNTVVLFDPPMQKRVIERVGLEADLRTALAEGQFLLHYQPLADIEGRMTGAEALVRWLHPQRGLVSPAEFIPVVEDNGMILELGDWVLRSACTVLARWRGPGTARLTMAVNVSAHQFHRPDFVARVLSALADTGADAHRLKLELTESVLINDVEGTIGKMGQLRERGVGFSLDDFGTGYSSLSSLHRLPLNQLKIDQSFVRDAVHGAHGAVIARTILALGKELNLAVLAEGVETAEQFTFIESAGCKAYQGYLFSRPLPEAALEEFLRHAVL